MKLKIAFSLALAFFLATTLLVAEGARAMSSGATIWRIVYWGGLGLELVGLVVLAWLGRSLVSQLDDTRKLLAAFSDGDLSRRLPPKSVIEEMGSIARSVNSVGEAQCALVTELKEGSQALEREARSFETTFARIRSQSQRSREASGTVAAALEEMTVGVANITNEMMALERATQDVFGTSRRLTSMGFNASIDVSRQYLSLQETGKLLEAARAAMVELETTGREIAGMANGIMDVAGRTRLLALNASIEAARAGEAGRGFSVVAQEVKELAAQSAGMAERIQTQVQAVSHGTEKVAGEMDRTSNALQQSLKAAIKALITVEHQSALSSENSERLESTSSNMTEIARTIEESKSALDEINRSVHEVDSRAKAVENAILGAQAGVDELGRFARSFQGNVKEMKVRSPFFPWTEELSVGVARMDDQHKVLLRLINRIADLTDSGGGGAAIRVVLGQLVDYTKFHFKDEEQLMETAGFKDLAAHRKIHEGFVAEVGRLVAKATEGDTIDASSLLPVLKDWLIRHIQGTDKIYGAHVVAKNSAGGDA
jgi:hemerythrin-like metal-binding protein